jgi:hypothetical protein
MARVDTLFSQHILHISRYIFKFLFSELPIHLLWLNELEGQLYTMAKGCFCEVVRTLQNLFEAELWIQSIFCCHRPSRDCALNPIVFRYPIK